MACIRVKLPDKEEPSTILLGGARITVGRLPLNTIQIVDRTISGFHAEFVREGEHYRLHDRGSTNGTFVNGEQTTDCHLLEPCKIKFGSVEAEFSLETPEVQAAEALPSRGEVNAVREENVELRGQISVLREELENARKLVHGQSDGETLTVPKAEFERVTSESETLKQGHQQQQQEIARLKAEIAVLQQDRRNLQSAADAANGALEKLKRSGSNQGPPAVAAAAAPAAMPKPVEAAAPSPAAPAQPELDLVAPPEPVAVAEPETASEAPPSAPEAAPEEALAAETPSEAPPEQKPLPKPPTAIPAMRPMPPPAAPITRPAAPLAKPPGTLPDAPAKPGAGLPAVRATAPASGVRPGIPGAPIAKPAAPSGVQPAAGGSGLRPIASGAPTARPASPGNPPPPTASGVRPGVPGVRPTAPTSGVRPTSPGVTSPGAPKVPGAPPPRATAVPPNVPGLDPEKPIFQRVPPPKPATPATEKIDVSQLSKPPLPKPGQKLPPRPPGEEPPPEE